MIGGMLSSGMLLQQLMRMPTNQMLESFLLNMKAKKLLKSNCQEDLMKLITVGYLINFQMKSEKE